jgi:LacI family transcriptional regulator
MKKNVTLKDIAQKTGVHTSTVSRALSPDAHSALTKEVIERIRTAAKTMGYRPNRLASGLRTSRTMTVGLLIPDITNTLFPPIVRGVESILEPAGYASIIVNTDNDINREIKLVEVLLERGVDGIIDAAAHHSDPGIVEMAQGKVPIVTVNRLIDGASVPSVVNDDAAGIRMLLDHLYGAGHRYIAHIAGPKNLSTGLIRRQVFEKKTAELGLEIPPHAIIHADRFDEHAGWQCAERLFKSNWKFTAILCANDRLAIGTIDYLNKNGISCPDDISVTGFNDSPFIDRIRPGLTTVRVEQFKVGKLSADLLVKMMKDPEAKIPHSTVLPVQLIKRESVSTPKE